NFFPLTLPPKLVGTRSTASPYLRTSLGRGGTRPYQVQGLDARILRGEGRPSAQYPAQIVITGLVLDVETDAMAVPVEFSANDRFDPRRGRRLREFHRAMEIIFVGQR